MKCLYKLRTKGYYIVCYRRLRDIRRSSNLPMSKFCVFIYLFVIATNYCARSEKVFDVKTFGAIGDGQKDDTKVRKIKYMIINLCEN